MVDTCEHRLTVLLTDEPDSWQRTAVGLLEPRGVRTVLVRSGREALDQLTDHEIHVAVLDDRMPHLGGLQVLKVLRDRAGDSRTRVPPAILLSDHLSPHLLHEALGMQVFSVLLKPVEVNVLLDTLARVLRRHYSDRWPV